MRPSYVQNGLSTYIWKWLLIYFRENIVRVGAGECKDYQRPGILTSQEYQGPPDLFWDQNTRPIIDVDRKSWAGSGYYRDVSFQTSSRRQWRCIAEGEFSVTHPHQSTSSFYYRPANHIALTRVKHKFSDPKLDMRMQSSRQNTYHHQPPESLQYSEKYGINYV